jgi:hypothetical protein
VTVTHWRGVVRLHFGDISERRIIVNEAEIPGD